MKKLPFLTIALCALIFIFGLSPAAALDPAFPADNDELVYEIRGAYDAVNTTGPDINYPIEFDLYHLFVNHSGNYYYVNMSIFMKEPATLLGLDPAGNWTWMSLCHYYVNDGATRYLYSNNPYNWSELATSFLLDIFLIPKGTEPGDTVVMGTGGSTSWTGFELPVGPGTPLVVDSTTLYTVGMNFTYETHWTGPITGSVSMIDMVLSAYIEWEWSLGFLTRISFDLYENLNPNYNGNYNITSVIVNGDFTLVDYTLTDTPSGPYTPTIPTLPTGIPGFPIEALAIGMLLALVPIILIRKRRR